MDYTSYSMYINSVDTQVIAQLSSIDASIGTILQELNSNQSIGLIEQLARKIGWILDFKKFDPMLEKNGKSKLLDQINDWDQKGIRDCKLASTVFAVLIDSLGIDVAISFYNGGVHPYVLFRSEGIIRCVSFKEEGAQIMQSNSLDPWNGSVRGPHEVYGIEEGIQEMENRYVLHVNTSEG